MRPLQRCKAPATRRCCPPGSVALQVDIPPADVHGGYAMGLKWYHSGLESNVVYNESGAQVYTARPYHVYYNNGNSKWLVGNAAAAVPLQGRFRCGVSAQAVQPNPLVLDAGAPLRGVPCSPPSPRPQIDFPLSSMRCGGNPCTNGQYEITYFAAVSQFSQYNQFIYNPEYDSQVGEWITGTKHSTDAFPTSRIYIGALGGWLCCRLDQRIKRIPGTWRICDCSTPVRPPQSPHRCSSPSLQSITQPNLMQATRRRPPAWKS